MLIKIIFCLPLFFIVLLILQSSPCEPQMIHGSLYNGLFSTMSCIIHLLVSFQGVLAEDKGVFVDQKITESTACSSRKILATHKPLHQEKNNNKRRRM